MKKKIIVLLIFTMMLFAGCSSNAEPLAQDKLSEPEAADNPYAGTCASGQHCTTPSCGAYVDSNQNGACDRGE